MCHNYKNTVPISTESSVDRECWIIINFNVLFKHAYNIVKYFNTDLFRIKSHKQVDKCYYVSIVYHQMTFIPRWPWIWTVNYDSRFMGAFSVVCNFKRVNIPLNNFATKKSGRQWKFSRKNAKCTPTGLCQACKWAGRRDCEWPPRSLNS